MSPSPGSAQQLAFQYQTVSPETYILVALYGLKKLYLEIYMFICIIYACNNMQHGRGGHSFEGEVEGVYVWREERERRNLVIIIISKMKQNKKV